MKKLIALIGGAVYMALSLLTAKPECEGQVVHYECRNVDRGTWQRIDENTVIAIF